jgi:hypothetical protein
MNKKWISYQAWVAHFDILGFKSLIGNEKESLTVNVLKSKIEEVVDELEKSATKFNESVECLFYADTFVIYSRSEKINDYPGFIRVCKDFYYSCIYKQLPIRGAVSFGEIEVGYNKRILIGKAFLESHEYSEDQNWLGMILTPSASSKLKEHGIEPIRHGFVNCDIPLRKYPVFDERVYAFCFDRGSTNFKCPLIRPLNAMMEKAKKNKDGNSEIAIVKYDNTIKFIEKHYNVHKSS